MKLTQHRLNLASSILEQFRTALERNGRVDTWQFEKQLRDVWKVGHQSFKDLAIDLVGIPRYSWLAAYYMQFSGDVGPPVEFKRVLAGLYGLEIYDCEECESLRARYWSRYSQPCVRE